MDGNKNCIDMKDTGTDNGGKLGAEAKMHPCSNN